MHVADQGGDSKFVRVAYAGGKGPPDGKIVCSHYRVFAYFFLKKLDLEDADGICEWLDERQLVEMEWQKLKKTMESARNLEMAAKRGEEDG